MLRIVLRSLRLALPLCLAGMMTGCSTVDMPKGKNKEYTSARFLKAKDTAMAGTESSVELNRMIQDSIGAEFEKRGIAMGSGDAELIVAYMLIVQDRVSTTRIDDYYGYRNDGSKIQDKAHTEGVLENNGRENVDRGAIVIDLVDAGSDKLLYRDFAVRDILGDVPDDQRRTRIQEAVQEALAAFFR